MSNTIEVIMRNNMSISFDNIPDVDYPNSIKYIASAIRGKSTFVRLTSADGTTSELRVSDIVIVRYKVHKADEEQR